MAASAWTPVDESKAPSGWTPVEETRSAASPIAPPTIQRPSVSMHPSFLMGDPNSDATPQSLPDVATGMAKNMGHLAAMAPVVEHRILQRHGIAGPSDMFPGEHTLDQVEKQDVPNAALTMMGAEGVEAPEPGVPKIAPKISPPAPTEGPGMIARLGKVALKHTPGVGVITDTVDAIRGPEPPAPKPPRPAIAKVPETEGIQWGTGGKGPIDLRGKMIPPAKPAAPITYPPEAPNVIARPKAVAPERARFLEDKSTQEEIRDAAEREDHSRLSQEKREWFARNQAGSTKAELTGQTDKPVKYTKSPIAKLTSSEPVGVTTPETDDLTPVLKKSLAEARKRRGASR